MEAHSPKMKNKNTGGVGQFKDFLEDPFSFGGVTPKCGK